MARKRTKSKRIAKAQELLRHAPEGTLERQVQELEKSAPELHAAMTLLGLHAAAQAGLWIDPPPRPTPIDPWASGRAIPISGSSPMLRLRCTEWWCQRDLRRLFTATAQVVKPILPPNWCEKVEARMNQEAMMQFLEGGEPEFVELGCD